LEEAAAEAETRMFEHTELMAEVLTCPRGGGGAGGGGGGAGRV